MLLAVGAKPVFCDIRLDTYNIDENKIVNLITDKTKAITPVHFAGHPCEMKKIKEIADKDNLIVIEDACHALGANYRNSKVGDCKYSDMTVFSFHPVKPITTGEGGAIVTNNEEYYKKMLSLRSHGIYKDENGKNVMAELGYNYRLTDIQAALGLSQLKKLDEFIEKRHEVVSWYRGKLKDMTEIILPIELPNNYSGWHIYVIRVKNQKNRDGLMKYLKDNGVGANFHYPAVYSHPYYRKNGFRNIELENEKEYQDSCITLPCYQQLKKSEVKYITNTVKQYFKKEK